MDCDCVLPPGPIKVYVYGPAPPSITTFTDPPKVEQVEFVVVSETILNPFWVLSAVEYKYEHNPTSSTLTAMDPADNPVRTKVLEYEISLYPLLPE